MPAIRLAKESAAYTRVSLWQNGGSYVLRASLPPKPGKVGPWRQQWVSTHCKATKQGLQVAKAKAAKLESDLCLERFDWADWLKSATSDTTKSAHDWVTAFLEWKAETVKVTTVANDYIPYTALIDCDRPLDSALLTEACRSGTIANSRARKACVRCFKELARYAGVTVDLSGLAGNYSPPPLDPKAVPSDAEIEATWKGISSAMVRWWYGMMATYGIRPHELYHLDCSRLGEDDVLTVLRGKTGRRVVYPYLPRWVKQFRLWDVPAFKIDLSIPNKSLGQRISKEFKRHNIRHKPYALRHAYAIRLARAPNGGVPVAIAAKWMGHSVAIHTRTYHGAMSEREYQEVWARVTEGD